MAVVGAADLLVRPSFKGFQKQSEQAAKQAGNSITGSIGDTLKKWAGRAAKTGVVAVSAAVAATVTKGVQSALSQQQTRGVLTGLYGDAKLAHRTVQQLNDVTKKSPLNGAAFRRGAESLAYAGVQGEEAVNILENVGLAITGSGGTQDQLRQFNDGILKMVNSGTVGLDALNQVSASGVPIYSSLSEYLGVSVEELRTMATDGKIGLEDVLHVLDSADTEAFQKALQAGEKAQESFTNQIKIGWNNITETMGERLAPAVEWATEKVTALAGWLSDNLPGAFDKVAGAVTTFIDNFKAGEGAAGTLRWAFETLWEVVQPFIDFLARNVPRVVDSVKEKFTEFADAFMEGEGAAGMLRTALEWLVDQFNEIVDVGRVVVDWLIEHDYLVWGLVKAFAAWKAIQTVVTAAQWLMNAAMAANPIGLVVAAIAGLVAGLVLAYQKSETFRNVVDTVWSALKTGATAVWNLLKDHVFPFFQRAFDQLINIFNAVKESRFWGWLKDTAETTWNFLKNNVFPPLQTAFEWLAETFVEVKDKLVSAWEKISDAFDTGWSWIKEHVVEPFQEKWEKAKEFFETAMEVISEEWESLKETFDKVWSWIKEHIVEPFQEKWGELKEGFGVVVAYLGDKWEEMKERFQPIYDWIVDKIIIPFKENWDMLADNLPIVWDVMTSKFQSLGEAFLRTWEFIDKWVIQPFVSAWNWVRDKFTETKESLSRAWNSVKETFVKIWNFIDTYVVQPFVRAFNRLKEQFQNTTTSLGRLWESVKETFSRIWNWIKTNIIDGWMRGFRKLTDGFRNSSSTLKNLWEGVKNTFSTVWNFIKNSVFAPFKSGLDSVKNKVSTVQSGIRKAWNKVKSAFGTPIRAVINFINKPIDGYNRIANKLKLPTIGRLGGISGFQTGGYVDLPWSAKMRDPYLGVTPRGAFRFEGEEFIFPRWMANQHRESFEAMLSGAMPVPEYVPGYATGGRVKPVPGRGNTYPGHTGLDFPAGMGTPVRATAAGKVTSTARWGHSYGWHVRQALDNGWRALYAHLSSIRVSTGQKLAAGQVLGGVGSTGNSTGPHLHLEVTPGGYGSTANVGYTRQWLSGSKSLPAGAALGAAVLSKEEKAAEGAGFSSVKKWFNNIIGKFTGPLNTLRNAVSGFGPFGTMMRKLGSFVADSVKKYIGGKLKLPGYKKYDDGGLLPPGGLAYHSSRMSRPDAVLTAGQWDDIHALARRGGGGATYNVHMELDPTKLYAVSDLERLIRNARRLGRQRVGSGV